MKMKPKLILAAVNAALFILLIILLKTVDTAPIGAAGTVVGFSGVNRAVHEAFGENLWLYTATQWAGYVVIASAAAFAVLGLVQLLKRKSIKKVDKELLALAAIYAIVILLYLFFEVVAVNYRPMLMPGKSEAEASFPSSHTMAAGVIIGCAELLLERYVKNASLCRALELVGAFVAIFVILGRLISGVHWFTDILAGLLITAALICLFGAALDFIDGKKADKQSASPDAKI